MLPRRDLSLATTRPARIGRCPEVMEPSVPERMAIPDDDETPVEQSCRA